MPDVHFTISFESLTNLVRQGWAEGRYQWAMDLLRESGCPKEFHADVIRGKAKMVTWTLDGKGTIHADDWQPEEGYPDPDHILEMAQKGRRWRKELFRRLRVEYNQLDYERQQLGTNISRNRDIAHQAKQFPEEFIAMLPESRKDLWNWARMEDSKGPRRVSLSLQSLKVGLPDYAVDLDAYVAHERELAERVTPGPQAPATLKTGWILPNGKAYPCGWNEHDWLAYRLDGGSTQQAETQGWILLGRTPVVQRLSPTHLSGAPITQAQIDTLWDWCQGNGLEMPDWALEGE